MAKASSNQSPSSKWNAYLNFLLKKFPFRSQVSVIIPGKHSIKTLSHNPVKEPIIS
jgi:hypothetical protein